jgi:hypothetical protein
MARDGGNEPKSPSADITISLSAYSLSPHSVVVNICKIFRKISLLHFKRAEMHWFWLSEAVTAKINWRHFIDSSHTQR